MKAVSRDTVLASLHRLKAGFEREYGVTRIGIFGSIARDEAVDSSDVDIVVELREPDLFFLVHIKETLTRELDRPVDIVNLRESMNEYLKERIRSEAVYA